MASRKEQKEALRAERERKAQEAAAAERRRRLIGYGAAGALVAAVVIAIAVVLITSGGGAGGGDDAASGEQSAGDFEAVSVPAKKATDLKAAVDAAGCKFTEYDAAGQNHVEGPVEYKTNPPHSGDHSEHAAEDGLYAAEAEVEDLVHSTEHGRVVLWFRPDASAQVKGQLKSVYEEDSYHVILAANPRDMRPQVAASSWTRTLTCPRVNDQTWDALRLFRDQYRDQGPETVP